MAKKKIGDKEVYLLRALLNLLMYAGETKEQVNKKLVWMGSPNETIKKIRRIRGRKKFIKKTVPTKPKENPYEALKNRLTFISAHNPATSPSETRLINW